MTAKIRQRSESLARRPTDSIHNQSFSLKTTWRWFKTRPSRSFNSRFWIINRFTSLVRSSKCLFFLHRDRRADSRFDIIRRSFLSSSLVEQVAEVRIEPWESEPGLGGPSLARKSDRSSSISVAVNSWSFSSTSHWNPTPSSAIFSIAM